MGPLLPERPGINSCLWPSSSHLQAIKVVIYSAKMTLRPNAVSGSLMISISIRLYGGYHMYEMLLNDWVQQSNIRSYILL